MNAATTLQCPVCAARLPDGLLAGLCPACAWRELGEPYETGASREADTLFTVSGHDVLAEIARGGAGIVYRARQREPRREVALKMLLPQQLASAEMRGRFRLEAETIAALDHPAILPVYAVGEHNGLPFFTMKLATGGTLAARRESLRQRWRDIASLVARLADAVHFAHTRGVIHRDVKPANVLFDEADGAYVSDFGLAKFTTQPDGLTLSINVLGTPAYLAPEVIEHGAGAATTAGDVYGLGAIFYELLTGRVPFAADTLPALLREVTERTPERPSRLVSRVPHDLEVICLRCLDKEPGKRLPGAGALAEDLRRWLAGRSIQARPVSKLERTWQWARRNPALASLSVLLGAAVVGSGGALWLANRELTATLAQVRAAEADATDKLHHALLTESRLTRQSRRLGQHYDSLALAERAARIAPTVDARSEVAAALAKPDLTLVKRLPGFFPGQLTATDYSPDLSTYLSAVSGGGMVLRNTKDGQILRQYRLPPKVTPSVSRFSNNGKFFSAVLSDSTTGFWETSREDPLWIVPMWPDAVHVKTTLHPSEPIVAYRGLEHEVLIRDLRTGRDRTLAPGGERIYVLGYHPDGERLLIVRKGNASLVDATTGQVAWSVDGDHIGLTPAWSADGTVLATATFERNEIVVRDAATGHTRQVLFGHSTLPAFIAFQPDGRRLVSMALDRTVRLWDAISGREMLTATLPTRGFRLSPDGRQIAAAVDSMTPAIFAWAPETVFGELVGRPDFGPSSTFMDISRDGNWLLSGVRYERRHPNYRWFHQVRIWDARRGVSAASFEFPEMGLTSAKFQPNTPAIIYGGSSAGLHRRTFSVQDDGKVIVGEEENLGANRDGMLLGFNRDGREWFIHRPKIGSVVIWPEGRPEEERPFASTEPGENVGVSPDGQWVASAAMAVGDLRLRRIRESGTPAHGVHLERESIYFSADSRRLLITGEEGFRVWDMMSRQPGPAWKTGLDGEPRRSAAFSPDGRYLASEVMRGTIDLRDATTFDLLVRLEPPSEFEASRFIWAPDNSRIYLLARGPRLYYWDLVTLRRELAARGLDW